MKNPDLERIIKEHPDADSPKVETAIRILRKLREAGLVRSGYGLATPLDRSRPRRSVPRVPKP
jgi:hypothetical protein